MTNNRRGRPHGGKTDAQDRILEAARELFLAKGYIKTTMREVAASAQVDVALINYYFKSKKGLLGQVLVLSASPPQLLNHVLKGDEATLPERLINTIVANWDTPRFGDPMISLINEAMQDPYLFRLVTEYMEREVIDTLTAHIGGVRASEKAAGAMAIISGLIFSRYIARFGPLHTMSRPEIVHALAPLLRRCLQ